MCWVEDSGEFVLGSPLIALAASPQASRTTCSSTWTRAAPPHWQSASPGSGRDDHHRRLERARDDRGGPRSDPTPRVPVARAARSPGVHVAPGHDQGADRRPADGPADQLSRSTRSTAASPRTTGTCLDAVLGPNWPKNPPGGVPGWRAAIRASTSTRNWPRSATAYTSAKEVRGEKRNGRLYDFVLASRHPLAKRLFEDVTKETAHGQMRLI